MTHKCVVRNENYKRGEFNIRERHNERKNEHYGNGDIEKERSDMNVHFKKCEGTYEQTFNKMVKDSSISLRGLKQDADLFDELVFDVNTTYFEENGGYEYAKKFFEEAYKLAIKEVGGEEYILSAVMHADERNKTLSEQYGRDIYHYHLHVVYVPVVDKEVKWTKRCKDPELVGKVKEVIKQVSHSKKWPLVKQYDENGEVIRNSKGKAILLNTYSLLQDNFYDHMQQAGFTDFERGKRGSTAKHLSTLEYKIEKDKEYHAQLVSENAQKSEEIEMLDKRISENEKKLKTMQKNLAIAKTMNHTFNDLENMPQKNSKGRLELTVDNWKTLLNLAKKGIVSVSNVNKLQNKIESLQKDISIYNRRWQKLFDETVKYVKAKDLNPTLVDKLLDEVINKAKHIKLQQNNSIKNKTKGYER